MLTTDNDTDFKSNGDTDSLFDTNIWTHMNQNLMPQITLTITHTYLIFTLTTDLH